MLQSVTNILNIFVFLIIYFIHLIQSRIIVTSNMANTLLKITFFPAR